VAVGVAVGTAVGTVEMFPTAAGDFCAPESSYKRFWNGKKIRNCSQQFLLQGESDTPSCQTGPENLLTSTKDGLYSVNNNQLEGACAFELQLLPTDFFLLCRTK